MNRDDLNKQITVRLFQASNAMQSYMDKLLKANRLTAKQLFMMIIMGTFESDPKLSDIATRFETSHQNAKQILVKLERAGFVELYKDAKDSRVIRSRFTKQANEFWAARDEADSKTMSEMYDGLPMEDMSNILNGLLHILGQIKQMEGKQ